MGILLEKLHTALKNHEPPREIGILLWYILADEEYNYNDSEISEVAKIVLNEANR